VILPDRSFRQSAGQVWAARNQRWLSSRLAYWRHRIEQQAGDDSLDLDDETPAEAFEPAASQVRSLFGLSAFEAELLVLAAGVEIDAALRDTIAKAQGTAPGRAVRLTYALALSVLPHPHWDALSPLRPLRDWSLLEIDAGNGFSQLALRIDERMLHYLTGVAAFDERLFGIAQFDEAAPDREQADLAERIARTIESQRAPLIVFGEATLDAARKRASRSLACATFRQMGLRTLRADASAVSGDARDGWDIVRHLDREAALSGAGLLLTLDADGSPSAHALRLIGALQSPVIVLGAPSSMQLADLSERQVFRFTVPVPSPHPRPGLPARVRRAAERAMHQFRVDPSLLEQALDAVAAAEDDGAVEDRLWRVLRDGARGGLDALAQRIDGRATFDDLVVPAFVSTQLREIASQLRHRETVYEEWGFGERHGRGLGIAALFVGESGTGKTLAAEAIANETRLDLYRIDLASVVSKYIGETEKNLSRLFEAAEASGAILLFDEADALFGKRSEVKDSHDRYANIEVAYLLQRIESYRGLAILTTNMKSALDRAFLRRIRFVVQFPFPDVQARARIWKMQFSRAAPLGEVDLPGLAKLQLTGGSIRSVAINAAFKAADAGCAIHQALLTAAAHAEHAKLERTMSSLVPGSVA
jgi:ATPase family protein associated with various cellular activities (AAA)/winged helix domain-containing protein